MSFLTVAPHWLCPPGEGVFTVHTGKDKRERLQKALYGEENAREAWLLSLEKLAHEKVALFGVASDCGGGIQRGANWGPLFVREALLADGTLLPDLGDVRVVPQLLHDKYLNAETLQSCRRALYGEADKAWPVSPLSIAESALTLAYKQFPKLRILGLGGDHSVSYPLVRAWAQARLGKKIALLHFDAHTDLLSERLGVDICFGSWTYHVREFFPKASQLVQVGIRATGKERGHWESLGLTQIWGKEVQARGMSAISSDILAAWKREGIEEVYISFDIDALDTKWASSTGTPENNGLSPMQCQELIESVSQHFAVTGADLMEVAPFVNHDFFPNNTQELSMMTAASMARVLARALGAHA
jgi:agmatinase